MVDTAGAALIGSVVPNWWRAPLIVVTCRRGDLDNGVAWEEEDAGVSGWTDWGTLGAGRGR